MAFDLTNPVFQSEEKAREYLEALHWPDGAECPHCGLINATKVAGKTGRPGLYMCNSCRKQFTVTVGTIFEDSKVPLNKWLLAFRLLNGGKKGISANELSRHLGITYKSAWFMAHRIREAMKTEPSAPMGGPNNYVEVDETFVGGKAKNRAFRKPAPKKAVVSLVERNNMLTGQVRSFHVANVNAKTLRPLVVTNVRRDTYILTDSAKHYVRMVREFPEYGMSDHRNLKYARGDVHTNTAENFFSIFKRGVIGTYHHLSEAHLHRYCAEFDFRYNTRTITDAERTAEALKGARGKRLTYRQPASIAA